MSIRVGSENPARRGTNSGKAVLGMKNEWFRAEGRIQPVSSVLARENYGHLRDASGMQHFVAPLEGVRYD